MPVVAGTAPAAGQIEVAPSSLAEEPKVALELARTLLVEPRTSFAVAVRTPWLGELRRSLVAHTAQVVGHIALAART